MTFIVPTIAGLTVATIIIFFARLLRFDDDRSFYPTLLIVIASYYPLFAVMSGQGVAVESVVALLFGAIAIVGVLWMQWVIGAGLILHGLFDLIHPTVIGDIGNPPWWPWFCASVDIVLGVAVLYQVKKRHSRR